MALEETARLIVEAILRNLKSRRGIGNELEAIDDAIYSEMVGVLIVKTVTILQDRQAH